MPLRTFTILGLAMSSLAAVIGAPVSDALANGKNDPSITACSPIEIISVRGTTEPQTGSRVMQPTIGRIMRQFPKATLYNVVYPADRDFANGPIIGAKDLMDHLTAQAAACPEQQYVLAGYSQGAMVLHRAFSSISEATFNRIPAVIMFGDPFYDPSLPSSAGTAKGQGGPRPGAPRLPQEWVAKTRDYCNAGDPVCTSTGSNWLVHASYGASPQAGEAASFVISKLS
ncbi:uncharacterized protein SPPG_06972 [Spizellomyces punctatus DAOM BR117]|uniref:Cutinase n=1 Tax=Spizellomyces punctatus (strain DAOM BR117) TaxID=645134 RepID=A0A0L0HB83_SPIPD|nr:uncharacterized protein SPPG_06972 [Spizellomyces punctatus DAOM BR117]KNC97983.1 hypothetical protein SPPG_06972 [Spizellomyces punctatus DAOM BR117]|eukprot:XP_016606023.1 hypothetical protein SPPG_06972 [Spizellomyces punctatus DAOM BR117]